MKAKVAAYQHFLICVLSWYPAGNVYRLLPLIHNLVYLISEFIVVYVNMVAFGLIAIPVSHVTFQNDFRDYFKTNELFAFQRS